MVDRVITHVACYRSSYLCSLLETFQLKNTLEEKERATEWWDSANIIGVHCTVRRDVDSVARRDSKHPTPYCRFSTLYLERKLFRTTGYLILQAFSFASWWLHNRIKNHWPAICNHPTDYYSDYIRLREHHPQLNSSHHITLIRRAQIVCQGNNESILSQ